MSPLIAPLALDDAEKTALVAFLKALTGDNVEALAIEARRAPATLPVPTRDAFDAHLESLQANP